MTKEILATNIDGFSIKHQAFVKPHKAWFDRVITLTKDKSLAKWKNREDYFKGVNIAMKKILPKASKEKRTAQARQWYQKDVLNYIKSHPNIVYRKPVKILKKLKLKYTLALITTNTKEYIQKILKTAKLEGI